MDKLNDKFKSISHKEDIKISFVIKIKQVTGLSKSSYTPLLISWKRGSKKENTGEIKVIPRDGEANVDHTLNINATITKTPKGFEEKSIIFTIKEEKMNKKPVPLGSINVNLAQYAESKTEKTHPFPIKDKSKVVCNLYLGIQSSWLKVNGKTLVKAEGNQKEILSELGKQQIKGADGSDYFLQTEQDISDPEQTDIGNDNFSDGEDEDDVSFEDDSKEDKSNVSTLSRKSSNLSSSDKEGSTSTPIKSTSSINADGTTLNTGSTSTTSTSSTTSTTGATLALYEVKMKKYKKKLKLLKTELEKSKTATTNVSKERDDKVKEIKTMLDEMETIRERSKSVGNGVIADYTNQIDSLTLENKDLKQQIQRERTQSNQDSNQVTTLQNQVISLNQQLETLRTQNTTLNSTLTNLERQVREANSSKPEDLQNALATVQTLHVELGQVRNQLAAAQEDNRNQFLQIEQERLKSNANEANANRVSQENVNLQQQLEHFERTIHLQLEGFEKEKLSFADELVQLKQKSLLVDEKELEIKKLQDKLESSAHQEQDTSDRAELQKEIEKRDNHISSLQDKLEALHDKIDSLESNNDSNNSVNESLMADKDREIEQLLLKVSNMELESTQFKESNQAKVDQLEERLKDTESKLSDYESKQNDHQDLLDKYESLESQLNETTKALQVAQDALTNQLANKDDSLADTTNELEEVKQQLEQALSEKEELSKQLQDKHDSLENAKESFENEKQEISQKLDETLVLLSKLELEKNEISEQLQGKSIQLNQVEDLYKSKQESESQQHDLYQENQEKIQQLQQRIEELTEQLDSSNNQVSLLTVAAATAAASSASVPDDYEELKEKVDKYKSKCKGYKEKINNYKDKIAQHEEEKEMLTLQNNISDKDQQLDLQEARDKNAKLTQEMDIYIDELAQLKSHVSQYQSDGESKQNVIKEYQAMIEQLQSELDSNNEEKKSLVALLEEERSKKTNDNDDDDNNSDNSDNEELDELREKVKYQKEKIKSLKEDLESKDDEWIDEKVKFEETISKLESEISDLKENSNVVVPAVVPLNNNNELIEQLKSSNQSLESQLSSLSIKNSELSNEIDNLQNSLKQSQSQSPPIGSPMSVRSNTSGVDMEDVRKELEENKIIESSIYWPEIDFDRNNIPYCGTSVWQMLDSIGGLSKPQNQRILSKIVYSLEKSFNRSGNDCKFISYWLSTVVFLLHKLHQTGFIQDTSDPQKSGIEISVSAFVPPSPEIGGSFVRDLQSLALNIYSKLITITEMKLEKVLIQSIFLPESVILDHQKSPGKSNIVSSIGSSSGMLSNGNKKPVNNINQTLNILDSTLVFLKDGRISDAISNQFLNQVFFFINAQLTNHLLSNTNVCTTTQGLEVKMGVSRLKEWCSTTPYKSASQQLDSSHEASNLLVIDKSVFMDIEAIKSIFQKLNLHQIKQLLESYTPDDLSPDSLPLSLKKALDANWYQSYDISSLPLQIDSSKKLKL
ncbi:hypothetical protein CYY_009727 [Polysphondylium violaceum]|uniref:C2 NT-type domain-containing protein n=1 Tax=Polysphondylium violaceum TaxID=133409 RepID=A0A8J4V2N5_9MYCE|nr:hypothetical protein CYY_009727 [Polysphondylium violaceum]